MFTLVSQDTFDELQLDAGVLLSSFDPSNPTRPQDDEIIATTTGGVNPVCTPTYSDLAEDVDNVPNNMMEFKHLDGWECTLGFTTLKFNEENTKWSIGAADSTAGTGYTKIVPRRNVKLTDFKDVWWVGDKSGGGWVAIKLLNALSTAGLSIQSTKNGKGTNAVTLTGHVSIEDQDTMPMEFYIGDAPEETTVEYVYEAITPQGSVNPREEGWYILSGDAYRLTRDTTVDANKTYYERTEA